MREGRENLLHVVRDEHDGQAGLELRQSLHQHEEFGARDGVETGAGFVEDQQRGVGSQSTRDEHALAFALREMTPRASRESADLEQTQQTTRERARRGLRTAPEINESIDTAGHDGQRGLGRLDHRRDGRADESDATTQFAPVTTTERFAKDRKRTGSRREISRERGEERRLTRAVRPEDHPVLP